MNHYNTAPGTVRHCCTTRAMAALQTPPRRCRSVVVTGSSRGLGLGLVKSLAALQPALDYVIATCRSPENSQELQMLSQTYSNIRILQLDVVNEESRQAVVHQVDALVGENGLNCLINNAGINIMGSLEQVTAEAMLQVYETNTVAQLMVTKAFLPLLRRAAQQHDGMGWHRAAIINMSSISGSMELVHEGEIFLMVYPYRIAKTALNMVTRCLAADLKPEGILCVSLHPGWVKTDMGGSIADMNVEETIPCIISLLERLGVKDAGTFLNWKGEIVPW